MKILFLATFFWTCLWSCAQQPMLNLEGWWTMNEGQHYFEDDSLMQVKFVGPELWDMDQYYSEMVPEMGLPVQVLVLARMNNEVLEIYSLEIAPEGCEEY